MLKFALLAFVAAIPLQAQDPRIGAWTLTSAQSTLTPPNKLSITELPGSAVHVVMTGDTRLDFTAKPDGHDTPVPGNPAYNQVQLRRIDKRSGVLQEKKDGAVVATIRQKLSPDGNELTIATAIPGHPDQIRVWTRSGGTHNAKDPLAGDWLEDLSKSRLRQGQVIKIDAGTNGTVHFAGDFSYTARFDGKPYDLKNSRNDSVSLQLVDPHTVDAIYRRDDQITQRDRWAVSADGQQMTLTGTATLESGQRLTETLGFKRIKP
jgi:hypothetical protein